MTNGGYASPDALIFGAAIGLLAVPGTVSNFGTITAFVYMTDGGQITNGGVEDTSALINSAGGIYVHGAAAAVANFGTIRGGAASGQNGVNLGDSGSVVNGAVSDTRATIEGHDAVLLQECCSMMTNFGVIDGTGSANGYGVVCYQGGGVTNGTAPAQGALIEGYTGLMIAGGPGVFTNAGTVDGLGGSATAFGVTFKAGGAVTNGGGADRSALIEGAGGVEIGGGRDGRQLRDDPGAGAR